MWGLFITSRLLNKFGRSGGPGFAAFILFAFIAIAYLMWNNFELPKLMSGETAFTKGKIIDYGRGEEEQKYMPIITYAYKVDDSIYVHKKRKQVYFKEEESRIGCRLKIEYEVSNPAEHSIEGRYAFDAPYNRMCFFADLADGGREVLINNNILKINDYDSLGSLTQGRMGEMYFEDEMLLVLPLFPDSNDFPFMTFALEKDRYRNDYLRCLEDSVE